MKRFIPLAIAAVILAVSPAGHAAEYGGVSGGAAGAQGSYQGRDLGFTWTVKKTPTSVAIQGELKNVFFYVLDDVELRGTLYDAGGKKIGNEAVFFVPGQLNPDEKQAFTLAVNVSPSAVPARMQVTYKYREVSRDDLYQPSGDFYTFDIPL